MTEQCPPEPPPDAADSTELLDDELDPIAGGVRATKPLRPFPDVAKTPTPGGPVPVPYPSITSKE